MKKYLTAVIGIMVMMVLSIHVNAQPNPPGPPGGTTGVPLDGASGLLLASAAILRWIFVHKEDGGKA